ncbi:MAG: sterol desaturase family protein [Pseudomonadota bacterium]
MALDIAFWKGRTHDLGRMTLPDLVKVYFTYPTVLTYIALGLVAGGLGLWLAESLWPLALTALVAALVYPLVEYLLHRFVLHSTFLYKNPRTAALWKRIHYDHHQNPHDLSVLFGALHTTLPVVVLITLPIGLAIGGLPAALFGFAAGMALISIYEFCHCMQHLNHMPKSAYLKRIKRLHLAHHFHNETGNFGITSFFLDRWLGTLYERAKDKPKSPTVNNLGYRGAEKQRYPWVAELSREPDAERRG